MISSTGEGFQRMSSSHSYAVVTRPDYDKFLPPVIPPEVIDAIAAAYVEIGRNPWNV
jgi:hypothetical protein